MESENKISYKEAIAKIEELIVKIEDPNTNLEDITVEVKRAMELIALCKATIRNFGEESASLLKDE
ncbi:MAG: exodeoxyribonuclease VII small subunit [Bacteroidales bacterium]